MSHCDSPGRPERHDGSTLPDWLTGLHEYATAIGETYAALRPMARDIVKLSLSLAPYFAGFAALHQFAMLLR